MAMHQAEEELDWLFRETLAMTVEDLKGKEFDQAAKLGDGSLLTRHGLKVVENEWAKWENWTMEAYDRECWSWYYYQIACLQREEMERQLMYACDVAMGNDGYQQCTQIQQEQEPSLPRASPCKFIPRTGDTAGQKLRHYKDKHNEREYRRKLRRALAKATAAAESRGDACGEPSEPPTDDHHGLGDHAAVWNLLGGPSEPSTDDHCGLGDRAAVWNLIGV